MSKDFTIETVSGVTVIRISRKLEFDEILKAINDVASLTPSDRRLWNLNQFFRFSKEQILEMAELGRRIWPTASKVAYVTSDELSFGLLRMFEVYREQEQYQTRVFKSEEEALTWLND